MAGLFETIREGLNKDGYSKEEEYFYRANRTLIERLRELRFDSERETQGEAMDRPERGPRNEGVLMSALRRFFRGLSKVDTDWRP